MRKFSLRTSAGSFTGADIGSADRQRAAFVVGLVMIILTGLFSALTSAADAAERGRADAKTHDDCDDESVDHKGGKGKGKNKGKGKGKDKDRDKDAGKHDCDDDDYCDIDLPEGGYWDNGCDDDVDSVVDDPCEDNCSEADLEVYKTASAYHLTPGEDATFTITVVNAGSVDATGVVVRDELADDVWYSSATSTHGSCVKSGPVVTCDLGTLSAGAIAKVTLIARIDTCEKVYNTATVEGDAFEANLTDNSSTTSVTPDC